MMAVESHETEFESTEKSMQEMLRVIQPFSNLPAPHTLSSSASPFVRSACHLDWWVRVQGIAIR